MWLTRSGSRKAIVLGLILSSISVGAAWSLFGKWQKAHARYLLEGPKAKKKPKKIVWGKVPGENRGPDPDALIDPPVEGDDEFYWMRDDSRKSREVLRHIARENRYTEIKTKHLEEMRKELYKDMLSHIKETDNEYPYPWGPFFYYTRTEEGKAYEIICRKKSMAEGEEECVLLDINKLAKSEGMKYCDVGHWDMSPDHSLMAYCVDKSGYETYDMRFKDLDTGKDVSDVIEATAGSFVWGADNSTVYYLKMDSTQRPHQLWRHLMGRPTSEDVLLFTENDERFRLSIGKVDSGRFIVMKTGGKERSETHVIDLKGVKGPEAHADLHLLLVHARMPEHRYSVEHQGDYFYILTNKDGAVNNKLVRTPVDHPGIDYWQDVFPYDPKVKLDTIYVFKSFIAIMGRQGGFSQIWVYEPATGKRHVIEHPEAVYSVWGSHHNVFDTELLRFGYSSLTTPRTTFDYNMRTRAKVQLKQVEVPNYDPSLYECQRIEATAHDGVKVPISIVYRKSLYQDAKAPTPKPLLLYGYGSYGATIDPSFQSTRITLMDRGVCYAIGHIRGGGEMGREWYEKQGKYLTKRNTFLDFISCAEELVKRGFTKPELLGIWGGSAGGLLMGACANMKPELFRAVVADVPFVDVLCTMADASIPLTVTEWEEWGNPNEKKFFEYMKSYSPVDNIEHKDYPAILATGGLYDPRVAYWEPLKYVAKLRDRRTDNNTLILKIDLSSGHAGASDRYKYLEEKAFAYAFLLDELGLGPDRRERESGRIHLLKNLPFFGGW